MLKQAAQNFKGLMSNEIAEKCRWQDLSFKKLNNKEKEMGRWVTWGSSEFKGPAYLNGDNFNQDWKNRRASREREDRRWKIGGGRLPELGPGTVGRYHIKNINQQNTKRQKKKKKRTSTNRSALAPWGEGENTQKWEIVRKVRKLLLRGCVVFSGK